MIGRRSAFLAFMLATPAAAQDVAIVNARVLSMGPAGEISRGTVVIRAGRIVAVGRGVAPPPGVRVVRFSLFASGW